jgi:hypothetical protein
VRARADRCLYDPSRTILILTDKSCTSGFPQQFSEQFNSSEPARVSGDTADTGEATSLTPYQKEPTPRPQHQQASFSGMLTPQYRTVDVPMVGLGLLLEQAWVAKQTHQLSLTDAFVSLDGKNERVWRVQNMAPGFGADSSGLICVGDIVVRVNGQSIPGVVFKLWRF